MSALVRVLRPGVDPAVADAAASAFLTHIQRTSPRAAEVLLRGQMDPQEFRSRLEVYLDANPRLFQAREQAPGGAESVRVRVARVAAALPRSGSAGKRDPEQIAEAFIEALASRSRLAHESLVSGSMPDEELASRLTVYLSEEPNATQDPSRDAAASLVDVVEAFVRANYGLPTERSRSAIFEGEMESEGEKRPFVLHRKRPDKVRVHFLKEGLVGLIVSYDGVVAWGQQRGQPSIPLFGSQRDELVAMARFDSVFVDAFGRQAQVSRDDGLESGTFLLRLREADGTEYVSTVREEGLVELSLAVKRPGSSEQLIRFSDHRKVGPLNVPFRQETWVGGKKSVTTVLSRVTLDPGLIDPFFSKPKGVSMDFMDYMNALALLRARTPAASGSTTEGGRP